MLRLRRAHQSPYRRIDQTRHSIPRTRSRTSRQKHEPDGGEPLVGKPRLQQLQRPVRSAMRCFDDLASLHRMRTIDKHRVHIPGTTGERLAQGIHIRVHESVDSHRLQGLAESCAVLAQHRPPARRDLRGSRRARECDPAQAEQRLSMTAASLFKLLHRDPSRHQRLDRGDEYAALIGHHQRHRIGSGRAQVNPQAGGSHGVQPHLAPRERKQKPPTPVRVRSTIAIATATATATAIAIAIVIAIAIAIAIEHGRRPRVQRGVEQRGMQAEEGRARTLILG